jgi:glycosyltransferase involved in cell wall biosynthesis
MPAAVEAVPHISFVIPVRDDATRLERCLASIRQNDCVAARVEIIVVDNGSADCSVAVAQAAGARVVQTPHKPVAELRNIGAGMSRASVLGLSTPITC